MGDAIAIIKEWRQQIGPLFFGRKWIPNLDRDRMPLAEYVDLKNSQLAKFKDLTLQLAVHCSRNGIPTAKLAEAVVLLQIDQLTGAPIGWSYDDGEQWDVIVKQLEISELAKPAIDREIDTDQSIKSASFETDAGKQPKPSKKTIDIIAAIRDGADANELPRRFDTSADNIRRIKCRYKHLIRSPSNRDTDS